MAGDPPVQRAPRRARPLLLALGAMLLLVVVGGALVARDVLALEGHLTAAETALAAARVAVEEGEVEQADAALLEAEAALAAARRRSDGPGWWGARRLPVVGASVVVVGDVLDVADAATVVARRAVDEGGPLLEDDVLASLLGADGRVDLERVASLRTVVEDLPVGPLEAARDRLADRDPAALLDVVADGREAVLAAADDVLAPVADAADLLAVLPPLLGAEGPRGYLVVVQNAGEMRGTGGFPGYLLVLRAEDGRLTIGEGAGFDPLVVDDAGANVTFGRVTGVFRGSYPFDDPVPRDPAHAERYDHVAPGAFFGSTNVDPDLRFAGPLMLALYERATGEDLDGVFLTDPILLQMLMERIGPLELPAGTPDPGDAIPVPVPAERIAEVSLVDAYQVFGGINPERTLFQTGMAFGAFQQVFGGALPDPVGVARAIGQAASQRHLQLYVEDAAVQAVLDGLDVTGGIAQRPGEDLLAVTQNNASADKSDTFQRVVHAVDVALGPPRREDGGWRSTREAEVRIEVDNTLDPEGRDLYFVTTSDPQRLGEARVMRPDQPGLNRTWFTVWGPRDTALRRAVDEQGRPIPALGDPFNGLRPVDHFLEVPALSAGSFTLGVQADVPLEVGRGEVTYRLRVRRTPKLRPDVLELRVAAPAGWDVVDVRVAGGAGYVVGGAVPAPGALIDDGAALVSGPYAADVVVEVDLAPAA